MSEKPCRRCGLPVKKDRQRVGHSESHENEGVCIALLSAQLIKAQEESSRKKFMLVAEQECNMDLLARVEKAEQALKDEQESADHYRIELEKATETIKTLQPEQKS